jgi:hypothetical protein
VTPERLLSLGYGRDGIHLLFNLWYDFNYVPAYESNMPQVDHIFPQSLLRRVKVTGPQGKRYIMKYKDESRNQLANCMLLTAAENSAGGKGDTPPEEWFKGKPTAYLDLHLIPRAPALWKLDKFEEFVEARKALILKKFDWLLRPSAAQAWRQAPVVPRYRGAFLLTGAAGVAVNY